MGTQSEGDISTNIQLGIFVPQVVSGLKKKKKNEELRTAVVRKKGQFVREEENKRLVPGVKDVEKASRKRAVRFEEVEGEHLKRHKVSSTEHVSLEEGSNGTEQKKLRTRRRTRLRRAKKAKTNLSQASPQLPKTGMDRESALDYLRQWESDRSKWSFRKKIQYWLLQNACDKSQIPKAEFKILLRYIDGLQGNQRQVSVARMQEIIDQYQNTDGMDDDDALTNSSGISKRMYKRAVAVLRVLA